jgi:hypothetical protein
MPIPEDDGAFLEAFEARTIPFADWTHRAHVRMAFRYLSRHPFEEALGRIRKGIQALNLAHQTPEALTRGYHETLTVAWARVVASTIAAHGPFKDSNDFCDRNPHLLQRTVMRIFYSPGRLFSPEAKRGFVEPDLAPLPPTRS